MAKRCLLIGALLAFGLTTASASAQTWGLGPFWGPSVWGYAQDHIPYFARHPAVYYSVPLSYSYGRTPYAALPALPASGPAPVMIQNTYVSSERLAVPSPAVLPPLPAIIRNPYVP